MSRGIGTKRFIPPLLLALGCTLPAREAFCQTDEDRAGARAAASEGAKAFREGRYSDALDFFSRAESLVHAPPHLLYMARSQAQMGQLVVARENLLKVTREDLKPDAPRAFRTAQEDARTELKAIEGRLPYVTLSLKGGTSNDVTVTQDGKKIPAALVGIPRPVDPGKHTFEASGASLKGSASLDIKEGEHQTLVIELQPGTGEATPATAAPSEAGGAAPTEPTEASQPVEADKGEGSNGLRIGSYVAFGVGGIGLIAGTVFALGAKSNSDEADKLYADNNCGEPTGCPDQESKINDLDDQASSKRTLALVGFIAGGVGIATGITLLVLSSGGHEEKAASSPPALKVSLGLSSVSLSGAF